MIIPIDRLDTLLTSGAAVLLGLEDLGHFGIFNDDFLSPEIFRLQSSGYYKPHNSIYVMAFYSEGTPTYLLLYPTIETENVRLLLKSNSNLSTLQPTPYGTPYYCITGDRTEAISLASRVHHIVNQQQLQTLWVNDDAMVCAIRDSFVEQGLHVKNGLGMALEALINDEEPPRDEALAHQQATNILLQCFSGLQSRISALRPNDTLSELAISKYIRRYLRSAGGEPLHVLVQTCGAYPRRCDNDLSVVFGPASPILKLDVGVVLRVNNVKGIADISDMFFLPQHHVNDEKIRSRMANVQTLYRGCRRFVDDLSSFLRVGQSGDEIFSYGQKLFETHLRPELIRLGISDTTPPLARNVGHWIRDYVEGTPFFKGVTRCLKTNDTICVELPLGIPDWEISINYEVQGVMTSQEGMSFMLRA